MGDVPMGNVVVRDARMGGGRMGGVPIGNVVVRDARMGNVAVRDARMGGGRIGDGGGRAGRAGAGRYGDPAGRRDLRRSRPAGSLGQEAGSGGSSPVFS
jgi:hypothetical protein